VSGILVGMHYCQSCDSAIAMAPHEGFARCPACGRLDEGAAIAPLFVVTGASGSGKTTVFAPLARKLADRCVTFDIDWLIDSATELNGGQPFRWPALRNMWLAIAHGVAQSGVPTLLLGPLIPQHLEDLSGRRWIGEIHFVVLDCPDDLRRQRIEARPPWRSRDIDEQIEFGRWLRSNIADQIDSAHGTPDDTAAAIATWVVDRIDRQL
jgi:hypothetical protein